MTAEENTMLQTLEARVTQLAFAYKETKSKCEELTRAIKHKTNIIEELQKQVENLQSDYANLKTVKMLDVSDGDIKTAKSRITKLVREVDKCIALLNA